MKIIIFVLGALFISPVICAQTPPSLTADEIQYLESLLPNAEPENAQRMTDYVTALKSNPTITFIDAVDKDYTDKPEGNAPRIMALLILSGDMSNQNAINIQRKLSELVFKGVEGLVPDTSQLSGYNAGNRSPSFFAREESLLIGAVRARYGTTPPTYIELKSAIARLHGTILGWFGTFTDPNTEFLAYVYKAVFGSQGVDIKGEFIKALTAEIETRKAESFDPNVNEILSADELTFLEASISNADAVYQMGLRTYLSRLKDIPGLSFVPAVGDDDGPLGNVLLAMAILDAGGDTTSQNAVTIQQKIARVVFNGIPYLVEAQTLSGKRPDPSFLGPDKVDPPQLKAFFTREEDLLIGTLKFRYGTKAPDYVTLKSGINRVHNLILSWFGLNRKTVPEFLSYVYKNVYGQPEGVDIKGEFTKLTSPAEVPTTPSSGPAVLEFNPDELNLGERKKGLPENNSVYLRNILAGKPALSGKQDGFTDTYLMDYLSDLIQKPSIPADSNLVGVIKKVEAEYEEQYGKLDQNVYKYQWLLIKSEKNDPAEAAKSCVDRIAASAYGQHLDKKWDFNSVGMVSLNSQKGSRDEKTHMCGMIFSEIVGQRS